MSRFGGTLFAALYGELVRHPWHTAHGASADAYSLFNARSSAMGWLTEATGNASGGTWGMNDAGPDRSAVPAARVAAGAAPAAWFQVSLTGPVPAGRPLPIQPFLVCAADVVTRLGTLRLQAVQLLLPVQCLTAPGARRRMATLVQEAGWFADTAPDRRTPVRVTVDGGQDPAIRSAAPRLTAWFRDIRQDVVRWGPAPAQEHPTPRPAIIDELWNGPAHHAVTMAGALVEWSPDAVGWLAASVAEAVAAAAIDAPALVTIARAA